MKSSILASLFGGSTISTSTSTTSTSTSPLLTPYPPSSYLAPLSSRIFLSTLLLYHLFPLHAPITLWIMDAPFGRFNAARGDHSGEESQKSSSSSDHKGSAMDHLNGRGVGKTPGLDSWRKRSGGGKGMEQKNKNTSKSRLWDGNLDGNIAWFIMEIVSPITFIATFASSRTAWAWEDLSSPTRLATLAYFIHYANRAIISPLYLAPKRSPQHVIVTLSSILFNLINGHVLGAFLASNPLQEDAWSSLHFKLGMLGWLVGFLGNVYHDELLHDLRRPSRLLSPFGLSRSQSESNSSRPNDRNEKYKIPQGGLFYWIAFPNYTCEWFEWICFSIAVCGSHPFLLTPTWTFVLAEITSMTPRAIRGARWYVNKFGERRWNESGRKGGRWIVIPGIL